jgi:FMN phosphatase YigB (HAD superfamily)
VVMATTTAASPIPGSLETLEETVQIAARLENGSLPSGRRNLEAVFFDLDDTLVLTHAADTVAHKAVQALVQQRIPLMNGDEMLKVFIAKFDVQPWDLTHQVEVTEWRARIWGEALKSQGVEDMELARVWPRHPLPFSFVCKHTAWSAAE